MKEKDPHFNLQNQNIFYNDKKQDIMSLSNLLNNINNASKRNNIKNTRLCLKSDKLMQSNSNNLRNMAINLIYIKTKVLPFKYLEKMIYKRLCKFYYRDKNFYNIKIINEIISNDNSHIVAEFKDFLIKNDFSEFFQKYYKLKDSLLLLNQIFEYYKLSSVVYPNYILLSENKYIYKNIQKKQKIIDEQQEQEEKINDNEEQKKNNWTDRNKPYNNSEKVFDSIIIDSILNQSNTSQIRKCVFGMSNENSIDIEYNNLCNIVNNINKAEDNCYSKFLEKNKLINNNIIKKESNNKINNGQNILNTNKIQINNNTKELISNNNNGNEIISRNYLEFNNLGKTHSNFTSNINKNNNNLKNNINNKGKNIYSPFINKKKDNRIIKLINNNISKKPTNNNTNNAYNAITENLTTGNIKNNGLKLEKYKYQGRNKRTILDYIISKDMNQLNKYFNSDYNINENHTSINNTIDIKNSKSINDKEKDKSEKKYKKNIIDLDKIKLTTNKYMEKKLSNENNKYIKKPIIKELLSLGSSSKETSRTFKLTESQREFRNSTNITEIEKKLVKYRNTLKRFTNANKNDLISDNIYKHMNNTARLTTNNSNKNKQISLDINLMKIKRNFIKHRENNLSKKMNDNRAIHLELKSSNERVSMQDNRYERINGYLSGKYINSIENNNNLMINKDKDKDKNNILINNENDTNNSNKISNLKTNKQDSKYSRNKTNVNYKNLTFSMINVNKFLNSKIQNTNNIINNDGKNILGANSIVNPKEKILANLTQLKDNLKLNLNLLKQQSYFFCKKTETTRESLISKNNNGVSNININLYKQMNNINNNSNLNSKKNKEFFPLSARELIQNNSKIELKNKTIYNIKNNNRIIQKTNKSKNKTVKNSLNENGINNILFGYSNSCKSRNKYIKKIKNSKNNNPNLLLSNFINRKEEQKIGNKKSKDKTISEVSSLKRNKRKISTHINQVSNNINNNTDINSILITNFNSSLNNWATKNKSRNINENNNLNEIKTVINVNYNNKKNINHNLNKTPNIRNKIQDKLYNSNKKNNNNEKYMISNKNNNNNNTRYYNIEVNINNDNKNHHKQKISFNKLNQNYKEHIKINSTSFTTRNLNINFNNYTNNYCVNYNNNSIVSTNQNKPKYTQIESKNYKYKRIKNLKTNQKGFQKNKLDILNNRNKNKNSFPFAFTDRNKKVNLFSPLNSYSENKSSK